ncbi:uncharacterized protein NEMAJ01_1863 [Nematocida major]|uniref:uncharacterized protein n=1 Tax=Nematocida major TaxID=1912982 RepID=UPI0020075C0F|nr:uncharacterized protein NEMAJ01_1863 [Nematocida major]KAH9386967.1 hypothetical protein NEMAJ01_1863 [Nematocida major]
MQKESCVKREIDEKRTEKPRKSAFVLMERVFSLAMFGMIVSALSSGVLAQKAERAHILEAESHRSPDNSGFTQSEEIPGVRSGIDLFNEEQFDSALDHFTHALSYAQAKKDQKAARKAALWRLRALFRLGMFAEILENFDDLKMEKITGPENEKKEEPENGPEIAEILQKSAEYAKISVKSPEEEVSRALAECTHSPALLKMRIHIRMQKRDFSLAILDAEVLLDSREKDFAEHAIIHCLFLSGKTPRALSRLEKSSGYSKAFIERVSAAVEKYNALARHCTASSRDNYRRWRDFANRDLVLARGTDAYFSPFALAHIQAQTLRRLLRMGEDLRVGSEEIVGFSERLLRSGFGGPTESEWCEHVRVLVRAGKYVAARDAIQENVTEKCPEYAEVKEVYNNAVKRARAARERERAEKERREEQKKEKERKDAEKKEKTRAQRRMQFVSGRRGKKADPEGFYRFLGVRVGARKEDVLRAYRKVSKKANVALRRGSPQEKERQKEVIVQANKAKDVLMDPVRKEEYDSGYFMTEKEKNAWGYTDEAADFGDRRDAFAGGDIFDILMNGGFGGGFGGGRGTHRVVYYM